MPDPSMPELPPDLPPEYADAYRRGFERAYRAGHGDPVAAAELEERAKAEAEAEVERTQRIEGFDLLLSEAPRREYDGPSHRGPEPAERPRWLVPAVLAGLLVLLLAGAYGAGLLFSSSVEDTDLETEEPDGVVMSEDGETTPPQTQQGEPTDEGTPKAKRYRGRTDTVPVSGSTASCESAPSVDSAGNQVGYAPPNAYDGDLTTAWRCDGDGVGETLTLTFGEVPVGELGLVPGYAKTDPRSGADRYAENNRLTRVRWTFPDGSSFVQRLDGSPDNRDLQTFRIPLTTAGEVTLEVLGSTPGRRNTIAVSELLIGSALD